MYVSTRILLFYITDNSVGFQLLHNAKLDVDLQFAYIQRKPQLPIIINIIRDEFSAYAICIHPLSNLRYKSNWRNAKI